MTYFNRLFIALILFSTGALSAYSIQFRTAKKEDAGVLYNLICELAAYERKDVSKLPLTQENLVKFGFGDHPHFYAELAEIDGDVVGFALYFYTFSAHQGFPVLYIEDLYVKSEHQKLGIGTLFFQRLATLAKVNNCCRLEGHVFDWNDNAIAFYEGLGAELKRDLIMVRAYQDTIHRLAAGKPKHPCFQ